MNDVYSTGYEDSAAAYLKCKWNSGVDLVCAVSFTTARPLPLRPLPRAYTLFRRTERRQARWVELMMWMNQVTSAASETDSHPSAAGPRPAAAWLPAANNEHAVFVSSKRIGI